MLATGRYGTNHLDRAKAFYDAIAPLLGAVRTYDRPDLAGYRGANGGIFLIGKPFAGEANVGNGTQLSFEAPSRSMVDAVHAKALELGGSCEGGPGIRGDNPDGFYAAYFRDPDGNKLAVFRFGPPDNA
jgi:catechol 2,3-dioxygenase-like lactoylglutathione lyase family enzyme